MTYRRVLTGMSTALLSVIVMGCAGPTSTSSVGLADATASSSPVSNLCEDVSGYYWSVAGDHMSQSGSTLTLQNRRGFDLYLQVGNRPPITGKVAFQAGSRHPPGRCGSDILPRPTFRRRAIWDGEGPCERASDHVEPRKAGIDRRPVRRERPRLLLVKASGPPSITPAPGGASWRAPSFGAGSLCRAARGRRGSDGTPRPGRFVSPGPFHRGWSRAPRPRLQRQASGLSDG
jgi:hypothetical protein